MKTLLENKSSGSNQTVHYSQIGDIYNVMLADVSKAMEAVTQVLKLYQSLANSKSKLQDRLGKTENDYKNLSKKYERAEEKLLEKDKKIGEIENNLLKIKDQNKQGGVKKGIAGYGSQNSYQQNLQNQPISSGQYSTDDQKAKLKNQAAGLFEHEIKKKDLEIFKLKDAVKKSIILQKDRIEITAGSKFNRFEVNNFYDGLEKDFNLLDSRKSVVYKMMADEGSDLRELVMMTFDDLANISHHLVNNKDTSVRALTNPAHSRQPQVPTSRLSWEVLNQPLSIGKLEVKRCITDKLNEVRRVLGMKPVAPAG
jgi:hypothetical protein